jgi:glycosyltransferase involved in cell wall biosynthesis
MRVAVINSHPIQYFGPLWREVARREGIELKVFFCCEWGTADYLDSGFGRTVKWDVDLRAGYNSEILPLPKPPTKLGFWETNNPTVVQALSDFAPDVLVLFGYGHLTSWRALLWARAHRIRVLAFSDSELRHPRKGWVRLAKQVVVRAFFSQLDGALPISSSNAAYYRNYGLSAERLHRCAQPIDGERFEAALQRKAATRSAMRRNLNIGPAEFVFAVVGKYVAKKRTLDVVQAWLQLNQSLRSHARLLLIGEGEQRPQLEKLARSQEAASRISLTGFVNQQELPAYYMSCDATVLASEAEPHGQVVTESLFLGVPAIVSDRVGCVGREDVMRDGETGLVYPCGDAKALSAAMEALMVDPVRYRKFAERAREVASGQDARVVAGKFVEAFEKVLRSPRPTFLDRAKTVVPFLNGRA